MRYHRQNTLRVWFTMKECSDTGIRQPAEAPVPKDRWITEDVEVVTYPPIPILPKITTGKSISIQIDGKPRTEMARLTTEQANALPAVGRASDHATALGTGQNGRATPHTCSSLVKNIGSTTDRPSL
jgi:hypothetical protein